MIGRYMLFLNFNPRSPCGERLLCSSHSRATWLFQSTLPLRGATGKTFGLRLALFNFNPRSPCGERHKSLSRTREKAISIHAPLAGSDNARASVDANNKHFNPRSPCGERPSEKSKTIIFIGFQSTLPLRGATKRLNKLFGLDVFQSTLPLRGATRKDSRN